ncbi:hypothetical protein [Mycobacterium sp.]|uniref:hypothetical protein n=1 Tax=Mycobacterium sp. TaxID=1785 RepID=UPI003C76BEE3
MTRLLSGNVDLCRCSEWVEHLAVIGQDLLGRPMGRQRSYKTALEGKGWAVTVVSSGGGWQGAGGATYTATQGDTYGVFGGGGSQSPSGGCGAAGTGH